jgi:hypothetical protein
MLRIFWYLCIAAVLVSILKAESSGATTAKGGVMISGMPAVRLGSEFGKPLSEEPRGPNVFIWYCCVGKRFHSIQFATNEHPFVYLDWGVDYDSESLSFPNCRGGKVTMTTIGQGSNGTFNVTEYSVSGTLLNGASMANCEVVAAVYKNGQVVNTISFRAMLEI